MHLGHGHIHAFNSCSAWAALLHGLKKIDSGIQLLNSAKADNMGQHFYRVPENANNHHVHLYTSVESFF